MIHFTTIYITNYFNQLIMFKRNLSLFVLLMMIVGSAYAQTTRTWTFNPWPNPSSFTNTTYWTYDGYYYNYVHSVTNTQLYQADNTVLFGTEGLLFTSGSDASNISADPTWDLRLGGDASVTIPGAKAGQIITYKAWIDTSNYLTVSNADNMSITGEDHEKEVKVKVIADGNVTISSSGYVCFRYISIADNPLTRFSSMGSQKYTYAPGATFSHTIIVDPKEALTSDNVSQLIEVTSTNSSAVSTSGATLRYNATNGRLTVSGLQAAGIGDAQLVFNYKGGAYTAQEYTTQTFQVRNTTTLSFSQSTKKVEYDPDNTSTLVNGLVATLNPADGRTITYTSSNPDVIQMVPNSPNFYVKGTGTVTITASVPATSDYSAATATYTIEVTAHGNITFMFLKDVTYVNLGKQVYLDLSQSNLNLSDVTHLYLEVTDPDNNTITITDPQITNSGITATTGGYADNVSITHGIKTENNVSILDRVYVSVTSDGNRTESVGESLTVKATIGYKYMDSNIERTGTASTTTKVTITAANAANFGFVEEEGMMFVGDIIGIPNIWGNASGYNGQTYKYIDPSRTLSQATTKDYRPKTSTPQYSVSDQNIAELILSNNSHLTSLRDTLFVLAKSAGTVTITATDAQNSNLKTTYTLTIYDRTNVHGTNIVEQSMDAIGKFPYTWDFSQGFDEETKNAIIHDKNYWNTYHFSGNNLLPIEEGDYTTSFGYYKKNFVSGQAPAKNITASGQLLTPFKGITTSLGSSAPDGVISRLTIHVDAKPGEPGFSVTGGHHFYLTELAKEAKVIGKPYAIYVKAGGRKTGTLKIGSLKKEVAKAPAVYEFLMGASAATVDLEIENCDIYWIAASTEARTIGTAAGTDGALASQHLATYSYDAAFDFDLDKVWEAEKIDAWEVVTIGHVGSVFTAALSKIENEMPANTGVILRQTDNTTNSSTSAYMIAKAKNTATYTSAEPISTNYLIGTGMNGVTLYAEAGNPKGTEPVDPQSTEPGDQFLTYIMSSQYFWGRDEDKADADKYKNYAGYGFFKIGATSLEAPAQMAYLVVSKRDYDNVLMGGDATPIDSPTNGGGVKMLLMFGDEDEWTNSIEDIRTNGKAESNNDEYYYTLQGNRIAQPTKSGVYIHQGKKIYVK